MTMDTICMMERRTDEWRQMVMLRTQLEMWGHMTSLDKLNSPLVVSAWGELLALKKLVAPRLARSKPIRMTRKTLKMKVLPPPNPPPPLCVG